MKTGDPRGTYSGTRIPIGVKILAGGLTGYAVASLLRSGRGLALALAGVLVVVVIVALAWEKIRRVVDAFQMLMQDQNSAALYGRLQQAENLAQTGDAVAAVEVLDMVEAHPAKGSVPLLAGGFALVRGAIAEMQGDLLRAEKEFRAAVAIYEQRWDRSAHSEALQKLGKVQLIRGDNAGAYRTFEQALRVGGGRMYRLSRVRTELYLTNIAWDEEDTERATAHATRTRELAVRWRCHVEHGVACDVLAFIAATDAQLDDASAWLAEAEQAFERGAATMPQLLRHTMAKAVVADARGDHHTALTHYLAMMSDVAELRAGWGWRDAQAYFVDLYSVHEVSAFRIAHQLHQTGDDQAVEAIAALLDLGSRTALRRMLRGGLHAEEPEDLGGADMQDIVDVLDGIAMRENTVAGGAGSAAELPFAAAPASAAGADTTSAYERLEALVSLRFRHTMQPAVEASTHDVRPWSVRWAAHVLQLRVLADGETVHVAGLWTTPDGDRRPFLHPVTAAQVRLLGEVTGIPDALAVPGADEPPSAPATGTAAGAPPEGVRAQASGWQRSSRFRHLISANHTTWTDLASLLLPAELVALLREVHPAGAVPKLLLVPDSFLWRMPWAALQIEPGHPEGYLVDRAVLATLPSLSLLEDTAGPAGDDVARGAVAYLAGVHRGGMDIERRALAEAYAEDFTVASTAAEFLTALSADGPRPAIVTASVHGDRRPGLAHGLDLAPGVKLSAARMLTLRFPSTFMINACLSAELDERHGTDPLGIPTVALCRGADAVIGGIFPLPDGEARNPAWSHPTASILAILYRLLAEGVPPSTALRTAQRRWRREQGWTPPYLWAGLVSITTRLEDSDRPADG